MTGTNAELRRSLVARVKGVNDVQVQVEGPFSVKIYIDADPGQDPKDLEQRVRSALEYVGIAGVGYSIVVTQDPRMSVEHAPLRGRFRIASLSTDPTVEGIRRALVKLVPSLGRLVIQERPPDSPLSVRIFIACEDGSTPESLIQDVKDAMVAVGFAGLSVDVRPLPQNDPRNELKNAGFIIPRREARINKLVEQEEERFAGRLQALTAGSLDRIGLVDDFTGTKVLCTVSLGGATPVSCFLPIYDRIYVIMQPETGSTEDDYYLKNFGLKESDFMLYCRCGKIVPVFKFGYGAYPEKIARTFIEDLSLDRLGARDLDYLAARYAWREMEWIKAIRENRSLSQELYELIEYVRQSSSAPGAKLQLVVDLLSEMLVGAETFEGEMWRKGHLSLPHFSPAMAATRYSASLPDDGSGRATTVFLDMNGAAMHLGLAQAFDASLYTGLVVNEQILRFCANYFSPERFLGQEKIESVGEILKALEVAYDDDISVDEYIGVFDQAETQRMRHMIADVLGGKGGDIYYDEIRENVRLYNEGIRKLARRSIDTAEVDVMGDLAKSGEIAFGNAMMLKMLDLTGVKLIRRAVEMSFEQIVEDTALGGALDKVRGYINKVPAHSVRLYRVQRKLKRRS